MLVRILEVADRRLVSFLSFPSLRLAAVALARAEEEVTENPDAVIHGWKRIVRKKNATRGYSSQRLGFFYSSALPNWCHIVFLFLLKHQWEGRKIEEMKTYQPSRRTRPFPVTLEFSFPRLS